MIPLNGKGRFTQGIFTPRNKSKYVGKEPPAFRSGFELKFFRWCDNNPNVFEWASETIIIPYTSPLDGKVHRYYTDGVVAIKEGNKVVKYIIEVKPLSQTLPPVVTKRKRQSTLLFENQRYIINMCKWEAAKKWCDIHSFKFLILTEKELGIK